MGWGALAPNPLRCPGGHRDALVCRGPTAQHVSRCAPVAQGIERLPPEQKAAGSNPAGGTSVSAAQSELRPPGTRLKLAHVESNELQVVLHQLHQLRVTASQWQGLGAQLAEATPPSPGQPFQPTTAAVNGVNAAIGVAAAAFMARTQATAAGVAAAAAEYGNQEAAAANEMAAVLQVTVI
jgi:hypothetical protein